MKDVFFLREPLGVYTDIVRMPCLVLLDETAFLCIASMENFFFDNKSLFMFCYLKKYPCSDRTF